VINQKFKFNNKQKKVSREVYFSEKLLSSSSFKILDKKIQPHENYFISRLNSFVKPQTVETYQKINFIDIFSGCGGFSLGVQESLNMLGFKSSCLYAVDYDIDCIRNHKKNIRSSQYEHKSISDVVAYEIDPANEHDDFISKPYILSNKLKSLFSTVDLIIASPPCQGHSNFNNHSRRTDDKNLLYLSPVAIATYLKIPMIIIENVIGVRKSFIDVVSISKKILNKHGYNVKDIFLDASDFGVSQSRKRHFLVASQYSLNDFDQQINRLKLDKIPTGRIFDYMDRSYEGELDGYIKHSELSIDNIQRINHLFDNNSYILPNHERPECHQDGHTYPSVYGRINPEEISSTITSGFYSPGRGKYIHPYERRALNAREASHIQGIPDYFWKSGLKENTNVNYSKFIGDAVPPPITFPIVSSILKSKISQ